MRRLRPLRPLLLTALSCLAMSAPAAAAPGDYTVRLTSTDGPHWNTYGRGPFIATPGRVYSGHAVFEAGDYRSWRANVVGSGSRIIGGRVGIAMSTPHAAMRGRIVVGTGNAPIVVYDEGVEGALERPIPPGPHDWVQFDLRSAGSATTSKVGENFVNFRYAELVLHDAVPPTIAPISLPSPTAWHGAGACIPFSIRLTDQGGGLLRSQVRRASDGAVVSELGTTQVESTKPGPTEQHLNDCIAPGERFHGDTAYVATVWDVGGTARELGFSVRADHRAPTIGGGPAQDARLTTQQPAIAFTVGDDGAGIAHVAATLDGRPVPVTVAGDSARLEVGTLALGGHVVSLHVTDHAGNGAAVERRFTVVDVDPPTLALTSPGARGEAAVTISVRATDAMSGVDATSWSLSVDGQAAAFTGTAESLTAKLGPLATGSHRIDVALRDRSGNRATLTHSYYVVPPPAPAPAPPAPIVAPASAAASGPIPGSAPPGPPGRTGVHLVDGPRRPVPHGARTSIAVHVVRDGEAVRNHPVELRLGDAVLASGVTDDSGVARISLVVTRPGAYRAHAVGLAMDPVDASIRVAPRLVLAVATTRPRAGQRVSLSGRIHPAIRGRRVAIEARVGGVWFPVRRAASTDASGRFRSSVVASVPGRVGLRVRLLAVGAWAPAISNQRTLLVRRR